MSNSTAPLQDERRVICDCAPDCEERINCNTVGAPGHWQCGWCLDHSKACHLCGCLSIPPGSVGDRDG